MMNAGSLRHRITFQTSTDTVDAGGGLVETWATLATVWASISPLVGRELVNAKMVNSEITHKIRIRHLSTVTPKCRALFGTRIFQIFEVLDYEERNIEMQIGAKEVFV
jgi:SPP1 family predicted phage head-tail adaptor